MSGSSAMAPEIASMTIVNKVRDIDRSQISASVRTSARPHAKPRAIDHAEARRHNHVLDTLREGESLEKGEILLQAGTCLLVQNQAIEDGQNLFPIGIDAL
jgi:hypothetical protein